MLVRSPLLTSRKWREPVSSGRLVCRCHDVFLWCSVYFVLLRFRLYGFVEAATLRSIVLRYTGAPIAARIFCFVFVFVYLEMSLFPSTLCTIAAFSFCRRGRRTFFPSKLCLFYLVTTGWIFDISLLCENSIKFNQIQSNHSIK